MALVVYLETSHSLIYLIYNTFYHVNSNFYRFNIYDLLYVYWCYADSANYDHLFIKEAVIIYEYG